jgi:hypothetical protein
MEMVDLSEFAETGYVVIDNWLNDDELNMLLEDYNMSKLTDNKNYQIIELDSTSVTVYSKFYKNEVN